MGLICGNPSEGQGNSQTLWYWIIRYICGFKCIRYTKKRAVYQKEEVIRYILKCSCQNIWRETFCWKVFITLYVLIFVSVSVHSEWEIKRAIMQRTGMLVYVPYNVFVMTSASDVLLLAKSVPPNLDHVIIHKPYRADINLLNNNDVSFKILKYRRQG